MATVNLGRLKPVFKGAYNSSTAYVIDDIVTYANETYINIQAGTNQQPNTATGYWTKLAAKGTDGTDVGATLTTQGDILYRDGSGLQRLAKGTAAQVLKMNTAANAPEWGNLSSDWVKINYTDSTSSVSSHEFQGCFDDSTYSAYKMFITTEVGDGVQHYGYFMNGSTALNGTYDYRKAGVNGYRQTNQSNNTAGPNSDGDGRPSMDIGNWGQSDDSGVVTFNEITIFGPLASGRYRGVMATMGQRDNSGTDYFVGSFVHYFYVNNSNPIDGFKLDLSSGNFERLTFALYGIKK